MSQNKPPVDLDAETLTNLYSKTGISVGTKLVIQVIQSREPVYFADSASEPTATTAYNVCKQGEYITNDSGDAGLWAYSRSGARLTIKEA